MRYVSVLVCSMKPKFPKNPYVVTASGRMLEVLNPDPALINISDVAFGLSRQLRYAGLTKRPYTVAQHSILCSMMARGTPATKLAALLHDASEAYIQDIINPVKGFLSEYKEIEAVWMRAIFDALMVSQPYDEKEVKRADSAMFYYEVQSLVLHPELYRPRKPRGHTYVEFRFLGPTDLQQAFTQHYHSLIKD